ncbi:MAG: serine/threonine protein kinase, partial [Planctomycetota bacterium]
MSGQDPKTSAATRRFQRLEELFHAALDAAPGEVAALLERECAGDAPLRAEVEALLAAERAAQPFLAQSPLGFEHTTALAAAPADPSGALIGPWRLERVLGEGGMGVVHLAARADGQFDKQVALKLLRPGLAAPDWLARFDSERRVLARLEHPGIARLLDAGTDARGVPYLAMEYVEGERIDRWCDARRLPVRERVRLFARVARAVAHAHRALVVHRDLKPANVLVDSDGAPRLLDFGIAKALESGDGTAALELTRTGERPLTPAYASPEQLDEAPVGLASDVWSLGIVLHELLTGLHPHRKETRTRAELELAMRAEIADAPSRCVQRALDGQASPDERAAARGTTPAGLARALRGDLDRIVGTALRKEPERRYATAAEFADDLERWLAHLPVRASGDSVGYRIGRAVRRHPLEFALAAALGAAMLVFGALFVRQSLRDRDQLASIQRSSDLERYDDLVASAAEPVPITPENAARFDTWVRDAQVLIERGDEHRATLERMRGEDLTHLNDDERRTHGTHVKRLEQLITGLEAMAAPGAHGPTIAAQRGRAEAARTLAQRSLVDAATAWSEAAAAI